VEVLYQLGLLDRFLTVKHSRVDHLSAVIGGESILLPDFTHLPVHAPYIALMPQ
jgi:hypothetical protein